MESTPQSRILAARRRYERARDAARAERDDYYRRVVAEIGPGFSQADAARTLGLPRQSITKVLNRVRELEEGA